MLATLGTNDTNNIPVATLLAVLHSHVVRGHAFSSDLANGILTMLAGANTTSNLTNGTGGGPTVKGTNNPTLSNIIATNTVARNGVVHLIDRVLLP